MIASRQERNFAPELVTVAVHTAKGPLYLEGRTCHRCPSVPAPGWPELHLPTYTFTDPLSTGLYPETDLETFTRTFERELARPDGLLVLAIHADVPDHDLDAPGATTSVPRASSLCHAATPLTSSTKTPPCAPTSGTRRSSPQCPRSARSKLTRLPLPYDPFAHRADGSLPVRLL